MIVIFRALNVKVGDPTELTIDVPILGDAGVVRHSCSLDIVHFIRIWLPLWFDQDGLLGLELFIEVLSVVRVIGAIKERGTVVMSLNPLLVRWGQHAIVGVLLHNHFNRSLGICWIGCAHSCLLLENAR